MPSTLLGPLLGLALALLALSLVQAQPKYTLLDSSLSTSTSVPNGKTARSWHRLALTNTLVDIRKILQDYVSYLATKSEHQHRVSEAMSTLAPLDVDTSSTTVGEVDPLGNSDSTTNVLYELPTADIATGLNVELNDEELSSFIESMLNSVTTTMPTLNETMVEVTTMAEGESTTTEMNTVTTVSPLEGNFTTSTPLEVTTMADVNISTLPDVNISTVAAINLTTTTSSLEVVEPITTSCEPVTTFSRAEVSENVGGDTTTTTTTTEPSTDNRYYTSEDEAVEEEKGGNATASTDGHELSDSSHKLVGDKVGDETDRTMSNNFHLRPNTPDDIELLEELRRTEKILQIQMELLKHLNRTLGGENEAEGSKGSGTEEAGTEGITTAPTTTTTPSGSMERLNKTETEMMTTVQSVQDKGENDTEVTTLSNLESTTTLTSVQTGDKDQDIVKDIDTNTTHVANTTEAEQDMSNNEAMILTHVPKITIIHKIVKPKVEASGDQEERIYQETLRRSKDLIKTAMASISLYPAAYKRYKVDSVGGGGTPNRIDRVGEIYLLPNFARARLEENTNDDNNNHHSGDIFYKRPLVLVEGGEMNKGHNHIVQRLGLRKQGKGKKRLRARQYVADNITTSTVTPTTMTQTAPEEVEDVSASSTTPVYFNIPTELSSPIDNLLQIFRARPKRKFRKVRIPVGYRLRKRPTTTTMATTTSEDNTERDNVTTTTTTTEAPTSTTTVVSNNDTTTVPSLVPDRSVIRQQIFDPPTESVSESTFKVFCTYDSYRSLSSPPNTSTTKYFDLDQLEASTSILSHCTHLIYAFAAIDLNGDLSAAPLTTKDTPWRTEAELRAEADLTRLLKLRTQLPRLKILAAVGGWGTPPQLFSLLTATARLRDRLVANVHRFVLRHQFDGALISWFYPVFGSLRTPGAQSNPAGRSARSTGSTPVTQSVFQLDDRANLVKLVRSLRERFDSLPGRRLELGLMAPPFEELLEKGFDVDHIKE